jgi:hypothetical protein
MNAVINTNSIILKRMHSINNNNNNKHPKALPLYFMVSCIERFHEFLILLRVCLGLRLRNRAF